MYLRRNRSGALYIGRAPRINEREARRAVEALGRDEGGRCYLRSVLEKELSPTAVAPLSDERIKEEIVARIVRGQLMLVGLPPAVPPLLQQEESPPPPPAEEQAPPPETTWLEIELVRGAGEDSTPVAGVDYRVVLPDGQIRTGQLDENGKAWIGDIPAGEGKCKVSFPGLGATTRMPA